MENLLHQTKEAFAAWRTNGRRHYSPQLREQAVNCLMHFNYQQVSEAIGVSASTLYNWSNLPRVLRKSIAFRAQSHVPC